MTIILQLPITAVTFLKHELKIRGAIYESHYFAMSMGEPDHNEWLGTHKRHKTIPLLWKYQTILWDHAGVCSEVLWSKDLCSLLPAYREVKHTVKSLLVEPESLTSHLFLQANSSYMPITLFRQQQPTKSFVKCLLLVFFICC